ncbi:phage tail protein [Furfurilactobacillus entadae]|uniref:phage tail protein n=1 Tax=Furfurilactobacillus entadae TaxID=2922307 RepID=UPI0035EF7E7F
MEIKKAFVRDRKNQYEETLTSIQRDTFTINQQKNQTYELSFTAFADGSLAYSLLQEGSSIVFDGQEFVVQQTKGSFDGIKESMDITATHVMYESKNIRIYTKNAGNRNYSVSDIMHLFFDNNDQGFTWEVVGSFDSVELQDLGNGSGKDALDKCVSEFNAVIGCNNRHLIIYSAEAFRHDVGRTIHYLHDSASMTVSTDISSLQNIAMCYGKTQDNSDDNNKETTYVFPPFIAQDDQSIARWGKHPGEDVSDERFTDSNSMRQYALNKMQAQPLTVVEMNLSTKIETKLGDVWLLINKKGNFQTKVTVDGVKSYPMVENKFPEITLDNSYQTLYDYDSAMQQRMNDAIRGIEELNSQKNDWAPDIAILPKVGEVDD